MSDCPHLNKKDKGSYFKCTDCGFKIANPLGATRYAERYGLTKKAVYDEAEYYARTNAEERKADLAASDLT